jgi:hypothetical protein
MRGEPRLLDFHGDMGGSQELISADQRDLMFHLFCSLGRVESALARRQRPVVTDFIRGDHSANGDRPK